MREIWSNLILNMPLPRVVTLIGGGGKTSLMYYLLTVLRGACCTGIGTTTTKLSAQYVSGTCFVAISSVDAGCHVVEQSRGMQDHVILISNDNVRSSGKVSGLISEWIDQLAARNTDVVFVVEGDGSAGNSLKGYLGHEPVIPASSCLVIPVIGIDSVGVKLSTDSVHRPQRICALTGARPDSLVTTELMTDLLFHPQGYLHNCPQHTVIVPFINKVESVLQHQQADELAQQILARKHLQVGGVIIGSVMQEEGVWLQA